MSRSAFVLLAALSAACAAAGPAAPTVAPTPPAPAASAETVEPAPAVATDLGEPIADVMTASPAPSAPAPAETPPPPPATPPVPSDPEVAAALASADAGKTADAVRRLKPISARVEHAGTLEDRMAMHALLGRRKSEQKSTSGARQEYAQVLSLWADPAAGTKTIASASADEAESLRRLGQALNAVGEALFFEAEQKRATALALRPPPAPAAKSDEAIRRHLSTNVKTWMMRRRALDEEAALAYRKIVELQPLPPPRWVIAAASRVGTMYEALPADLDKLPVPASIKRDPALLAAYRQALGDALAPQRERAKAAYRACQGFAEKYQQHDAYSKVCDDRLAVLDPHPP